MDTYRVELHYGLSVYRTHVRARNAAHACESVVNREETLRGVDVDRATATRWSG